MVWPAPYDRSAPFYYSGLTWQQIVTAPGSGNGYYILGPQFIAATLNINKVVNPASVPAGVQSVLNDAANWFNNPANTPTSCSTPGSCGTQKDWGKILDDYNNGIYPGGPPHCSDE